MRGIYAFLALDGDPVDVLIATPMPIIHGAVMRCRPIGMLDMTDEAGDDSKILAVPIDKVSKFNRNVNSYEDLQPALLDKISHFFEHYKDLAVISSLISHMRRILRKVAADELDSLGDTSTLADPTVVDDLVGNRENK